MITRRFILQSFGALLAALGFKRRAKYVPCPPIPRVDIRFVSARIFTIGSAPGRDFKSIEDFENGTRMIVGGAVGHVYCENPQGGLKPFVALIVLSKPGADVEPTELSKYVAWQIEKSHPSDQSRPPA